jgi:hypothetical protein
MASFFMAEHLRPGIACVSIAVSAPLKEGVLALPVILSEGLVRIAEDKAGASQGICRQQTAEIHPSMLASIVRYFLKGTSKILSSPSGG